MGKCCKKAKGGAKAATAHPQAAKDEHQGGETTASLFRGVSLGEAAVAAGILVFLPVVLDKVAPNALRSIKHGFELASKG